MDSLNLHRSEFMATDGTPVRFVYEEATDILEIFLGENGPATGIELTDHMILRIDRKARRALSLTLLHFSILSEQTEYGPRSFSLEKLEQLPADLRELVFSLLVAPPVNQFLKVSQLQTSPVKMPIAFVTANPLLAAA
jgi:hypothetical protein